MKKQHDIKYITLMHYILMMQWTCFYGNKTFKQNACFIDPHTHTENNDMRWIYPMSNINELRGGSWCKLMRLGNNICIERSLSTLCA